MDPTFRHYFILAGLCSVVLINSDRCHGVQPDSDTAIAQEASNTVAYHRAPVIVDGRVLFSVRGASIYPAEQRAEAISRRIIEAAADPSISSEKLRLDPLANATAIVVNDHLLMRVLDADAALDGGAREFLADMNRQQIADAINRYRSERRPQQLLRDVLMTCASTLILALFVWGTWKVFSGLDALAHRHIKTVIEKFESRVANVIQAESLWVGLRGLWNFLKWIILAGAAYAYLTYVLKLYPWTRSLGLALMNTFVDPMRKVGHGFLDAFPGLVFIMVVVLITRYALKTLRLFFIRIEQGRIELANFDRDWALPTYNIIRVLVIAFAAVVAYPYVPGSSSDAFKGISLLLGLVFSLGSSSVISNLVAGYSMTYRRAFKLGDVIRVQEVIGAVTDIGLTVTRLRTPKCEEITLPNSEILTNNVTNFSSFARKEGLILHTTVGIGYETPWRQVEAILLQAAERTPGLVKQTPPFVHLRELGDFAVTYELNAYSDDARKMLHHYTELHKNILDLFNEHGIQIMTPAYEGDPETPKVVPKEQWFSPPAKAEATKR